MLATHSEDLDINSPCNVKLLGKKLINPISLYSGHYCFNHAIRERQGYILIKYVHLYTETLALRFRYDMCPDLCYGYYSYIHLYLKEILFQCTSEIQCLFHDVREAFRSP